MPLFTASPEALAVSQQGTTSEKGVFILRSKVLLGWPKTDIRDGQSKPRSASQNPVEVMSF